MIEINNKKLCDSCFAEVNGEEACAKCGFDKKTYSPDAMVLPIGTRLENKIIIGRVMGKGGFGVTYLGYDIRMEKIIAVKEYYPNGIAYRAPGSTEISVNDGKSAETFNNGAEKFYTEAEMVAQFNGNPNIVSVYDYFRANNTVYLIMEFISGMTLKNYVKRHGKLTDGQALFVMDKIAAALSITHSAGVLHRDISPDNIMICRDGKVKLIDFGAARQIMAESSSNLTVVMKPGYTPIEQYTKKGKQGAWTDIYSLGVSVYYALTEVILEDPYTRMDDDGELAENSHNINGDLWNILKKCTMINASERYGSAIDLRKALKSVSAPIKAETIVLSDDDLRDDPEKAEEIPKTMAQTVPAAEKTEEPIEVFEDGDTAEAAEAAPADETVQEIIPADETAQEIIPASEKPQGSADYGKKRGKRVKSVKKDKSDKNVKRGKLGIIIGSFAAVIAAVFIGIFAIGKAPLYVPLSTEYPGRWTYDKEHTLSKEQLKRFTGDIKVTLDIECVNVEKSENGDYWHNISFYDGRDHVINVYAVNTGRNIWNTYIINKGQTKFTFVAKRADIDNVYNEFRFHVENVIVKGATVENYNPEQDKINPKAKVIQLGRTPDGTYFHSTSIPKNELESFNGDVKVTLSIEAVKETAKYDETNDKGEHPYYALIRPYSGGKDVITKADNVFIDPENPAPAYNLQEINVPDKFTFVISQSEISNLDDNEELWFVCTNIIIKSAALEKA